MAPEQQTSFDFEYQKTDNIDLDNFYSNLFSLSSVGRNAYTVTSSGAISGTIGTGGGAIGSSGIGGNYAVGANGPAGGYYNVTSNINYPSITLTDSTWYANDKHALDVKGDANFDGDVKLKGKSLNETLDRIEQRLALLTPNTELEDKWDELKELGNRYRELEKQILEKEKLWNILKK